MLDVVTITKRQRKQQASVLVCVALCVWADWEGPK